MRHHDNNRKFGRKTGVRRAFMRSLARNLIEREKIETTLARAKELRPYVEKLVTMGKKDNLASKRMLSSRLVSQLLSKKVSKDIAPRYKDRNGGYLRIIKLPARKSDGSPRAIIEFV